MAQDIRKTDVYEWVPKGPGQDGVDVNQTDVLKGTGHDTPEMHEKNKVTPYTTPGSVRKKAGPLGG